MCFCYSQPQSMPRTTANVCRVLPCLDRCEQLLRRGVGSLHSVNHSQAPILPSLFSASRVPSAASNRLHPAATRAQNLQALTCTKRQSRGERGPSAETR